MATKTISTLTYADRRATPAGKASFDAFVAMDSGKGAVSMVRNLLTNYVIADAEPLLRDVNMAAAVRRVAGTNQPPMPAEITPPRMSAFRGLFKMKDWDCWSAFLDSMEPRQPGYDTIVNLSNWFRHKDSGIAKAKGIAPTTEEIVAVLVTPKEKAAAKEPLDVVKGNPMKALQDARDAVFHLVTVEGNGKGKAFLATALKALDSYHPFVAQRQEDAEAEKARLRTRAKLAKANGK